MKKSNNDSGLTAKRSYRLLAAGLTAILMAVSPSGYSQDYARLGERSIMGSARYVGMSGAMSAIGGDPSAVHDNAAGLGLYRRAEVMISMEANINSPSFFSVPQASVVISLPTYKIDQGILFHNLLFSYRRLQTYNTRVTLTNPQAAPSLGRLLLTTDVNWDIPFCANPYNASSSITLDEGGMVNEFAVNWATNISNQWYVGAGIQVQSVSLSSDATFNELFAELNENRQAMYNRNTTTLHFSGVSAAASVGLIYRPAVWARLGVGLQTASLGSLSTYTTGFLTALTDSLRYSYAPNLSFTDKAYHHPWHLSTSAAFQIGAYAMLALQYDFYHQKSEYDTHSLRFGFEVIPVLGLYINGGYAYESSFRRDTRTVPLDPTFERQDTYFVHPNKGTHYASVAVGYRGTYMIFQAAYQYRLQSTNLWMHENAEPIAFDNTNHKLVFTLAWHQ